MQLDEIRMNADDQERGKWFALPHPVTGAETGIRLRIAGPDSATQRKARLQLVDDLAELADENGVVSAEGREKARLACLARCILDWEILEGGAALPFSQANVIRFLNSAQWVREVVDALAGQRAAFMEGF